MMLMWPGVWPGVGRVVNSLVRACSPSICSKTPNSSKGQTHSGALGKRVSVKSVVVARLPVRAANVIPSVGEGGHVTTILRLKIPPNVISVGVGHHHHVHILGPQSVGLEAI